MIQRDFHATQRVKTIRLSHGQFRVVVRAERMLRLQEVLNTLDPLDREILSLLHFEELTRAETANVLGIEEGAAAKRYVRALKRLKGILAALPGGLEGL